MISHKTKRTTYWASGTQERWDSPDFRIYSRLLPCCCCNLSSHHKVSSIKMFLHFPSSSSTSSYQSSSQLLLAAHNSHSDSLELSSGRWRFSNILLPLSFSSSRRAVHQWFSSSPLSCMKPTLQLKLSRVAAEMIVESVRRGARGSPPRPLKDWTAPPSLSSDHWWVNLCFSVNSESP